jgi:hypothetical protein
LSGNAFRAFRVASLVERPTGPPVQFTQLLQGTSHTLLVAMNGCSRHHGVDQSLHSCRA